jgi:predicted transcriptional regulator
MGTPQRKIEVDDATAAALENRAAEQGLSVSELVAELVQAAAEPISLPAEDLAELDRRWQAAANEGAIAHIEVAQWLRTWGTPAYKPWRDR